ncbi:hypothetical protein LB553_07195 [Mesorhizobium sp. CA8]|uniref:hypothetical protein n=1 Tax=Mesorhizobium sp. CA8 TaxID=2876637 RepID=UPI001CCA2D0D|nr:hypothetical protein [Mesorhizobium sp. CA8]MBZ9760663.1 hypothetical protein [Mesorhizobium sp. CA8]
MAMIEAKDEAHAVLSLMGDKVDEARRQLDEAERDHRRLELAMQQGMLRKEEHSDNGRLVHSGPDVERLAAAKAKVDKAQAELKRLSDLHAKKQTPWRELAAMVARLERYVRDSGSSRLTAAEPMTFKLKTGDKLLGDLKAIRATISKLKADRRDVLTAPVPSSEAKAFARAWVQAEAEKAKPRLYGILDGGAQAGLEFPVEPIHVNASVIIDGGSHGQARGTGGAVSAVALQCWMNPDAMIAALERDIAAIADDSRALDPAERAYRDNELAGQLLEAERTEEAMVEAALSERLEVKRRPDADPRAILCLADDLPELRD